MNFFNICHSPPEAQGTDRFGYVTTNTVLKQLRSVVFAGPFHPWKERM